MNVFLCSWKLGRWIPIFHMSPYCGMCHLPLTYIIVMVISQRTRNWRRIRAIEDGPDINRSSKACLYLSTVWIDLTCCAAPSAHMRTLVNYRVSWVYSRIWSKDRPPTSATLLFSVSSLYSLSPNAARKWCGCQALFLGASNVVQLAYMRCLRIL